MAAFPLPAGTVAVTVAVTATVAIPLAFAATRESCRSARGSVAKLGNLRQRGLGWVGLRDELERRGGAKGVLGEKDRAEMKKANFTAAQHSLVGSSAESIAS